MKRLRSLIFQLVGLFVVPMLLLLLAVVYASLQLHDHEMRTLVRERDERAMRAAAEVLTDRFIQRQLLLEVVVEHLVRDAAGIADTSLDTVFQTLPDLKRVFDAGLVVVNARGERIAASNLLPAWAKQLPQPGIQWILDHESGIPVVIASAQPVDGQITVYGGMSLHSLNIPTMLSVLQTTPAAQLFLVADDRHVLYAPPEYPVGMDARSIPAFETLFPPQTDENEHAPAHQTSTSDVILVTVEVELLNWTLVVREPWNSVVNSTLRLSLIAPLAVIPGTLLAAVVLTFGFLRVVLPMRRLSASAIRLAWGDSGAIHQSVGGIQEIQELQTALVKMTQRLAQTQAGMHSYIGAMLQGQEDERKRLARELHDDTLQALIALDQQRQMAQKYLFQDQTRTAAYLNALQEMIDQTIRSLRHLIRDMRPTYLEDLGLVPALEMLCDPRFQQAHAARVELSVAGHTRRLSPNQELALYRIAQEALSNAHRHAGASQIRVKLTFDPQGDTAELRVEDNGRGFAVPDRPDTFAQGGHYGLVGMVERAEQSGARLNVVSQPGRGTTVIVNLAAGRSTHPSDTGLPGYPG